MDDVAVQGDRSDKVRDATTPSFHAGDLGAGSAPVHPLSASGQSPSDTARFRYEAAYGVSLRGFHGGICFVGFVREEFDDQWFRSA